VGARAVGLKRNMVLEVLGEGLDREEVLAAVDQYLDARNLIIERVRISKDGSKAVVSVSVE